MPMKDGISFELWAARNPGTKVPLGTGAGDLADGLKVPGTCAGATARWCYKMLLLRDARETKPEGDVAQELQGAYERCIKGKTRGNLDITPFFTAAKLKAVEGTEIGKLDWNDYSEQTCKVRDGDSGVYWLGLPSHVIGLAKRSMTEFYYFEPELGLYRHTRPIPFRKQIANNYVDKLNSKQWWLVRVALT